MTETSVPLWSLPKSDRPPHGSILRLIIFAIIFNGGIILVNLSQIISYPLTLLPFTKPLHLRISLFTKASFGTLTIFLSERFAPTKFVITAGEGMPIEGEWLEKNSAGKVTGIKLPDQGIWISNHQVLADWLYIWSFMYLAHHHTSILITLKSSIKWIPFVGWACSLYGFIFLARNWATDKTSFEKQLKRVIREQELMGDEAKLALLVFPEGTLVTGNTRPISKKFADKLGVDDFHHTLLPRSTGLFFALRTLATKLPDLALIDMTVGYPGPRLPTYPEDHYDLSIWMKGVAPPSIHVHLRQYNVRKDVPIGKLDGSEGTEEERVIFDNWLRERWGEKDLLMESFLEDGKFTSTGLNTDTSTKKIVESLRVEDEAGLDNSKLPIEWLLELRYWYENLEAFSYFFPVFALWYLIPLIRNLLATGLGYLGIVAMTGKKVIAEEVKKPCGCAAKLARGEL